MKIQIDNFESLVTNYQPSRYLVYKLLHECSHGLIAGNSQSFKSFVALELAHCIATGRAFLGNQVLSTGKVFYVTGEGADGSTKRVKALYQQHGSTCNLVRVCRINLSDDEQFHEFKECLIQEKPLLVIYDTLNSLSGGIDNNNSSAVSNFMRKLFTLSDLVNAATLIVHHFGKDSSKGMEGSHAFKSNSDHVFLLNRCGSTLNTILTCDKQKDGEAFEPITIELAPVELVGVRDQLGNAITSLTVNSFSGKPMSVKPVRDYILDYITTNWNGSPITRSEIKSYIESLQLKFNDKYLTELKDSGSILKIPKGYKPKI